jgi:hypothetical protein
MVTKIKEIFNIERDHPFQKTGEWWICGLDFFFFTNWF